MKLTLDFEKQECASKIFLDLCEKWNLIFKTSNTENGNIKMILTHKNNNTFILDNCIQFVYYDSSIMWNNLVDSVITYKFSLDNERIQNIMNGTF
jgi:hypothetical protein